MEENIIAKNLLLERTCENCKQHGPPEWSLKDRQTIPRSCMYWYGEACGWQWRATPEERTCESWAK